MIFLLCVTLVNAQNKVLTGVVTDKNGDPIPGVNVIIRGTSIGTITDINGKYSIDVPANADYLEFSFIGMKKKDVPIENKDVIDVTLDDDITGLDEVVVVGYGTQLKKDLTSSVAVLSVDELKKMQSPRIEQTLAGRVTGVDVASVNSEPGAPLRIRIRGNNSINGNNSPLVVIDGVLGGDLSTIDVNDISSMQILKDASATSIYGSMGANGVIIISTKKGRIGVTNVDFTSNIGFQQVRRKIPIMTADQEYDFRKVDPDYNFPDDIDGISNPILSGKGTDWQDEIFQTALYQNYHLSVQKGNEKMRFYLSGDFLDQDGVVKTSGFKRGNIRANVSVKLRKNITLENRITLFRSSTNRIRINGSYGSWGGPVTTNALMFSAMVPVYAEDGSFNGPLYSTSTMDNPVSILMNRDEEHTRNYVQEALSFKWEIIKGLLYDVESSYTNNTYANNTYSSKELLASLNQGRASLENSEDNSWQIRNILTYNTVFNDKHTLTAMAAFELIKSEYASNYFVVNGFATEVLSYYNVGIGDEVVAKGSDFTENSLESFLGRLTYGYKGKYLLSASFRADGASKFAKNNKWAYFPSGSAAWVLSKEDFLEDNYVLTFCKIRGSYGASGSQAINSYQSLASYRTGITYSLGNTQKTNGAFIQRVSNPDLKWETTTQYDVGLDLGFWDGRLDLTADYFHKKTEDLLYSKTLPMYSGFSSQIQNIGSMLNKGFEFSANVVLFDDAFKWNISGNISLLQNEVLSLGDDEEVFIRPPSSSRGPGFWYTGVLRVGEPVGNFYGFVADGIYKTQDELEAIDQPGAVLGSVRYKDISGPDGVPDGVINSFDKTIIGNALPDVIYGIGTDMSFKNFDLSVSTQGVSGRDVMWLDKRNIKTTDKVNQWTPDTPENDIPFKGDYGSQTNSNYVEDGSYLKISNITFGYNFQMKKVVKNMRVYFSAINPVVFTNYSGFDPEVNSQDSRGTYNSNVALGYDSGSYPGIKQFLFGLNVTF
ncbi:MAG: TonB-dependent receptor [Chlorobi bacterium]|nr:TonB-dependent receptor [Chlorobiota bacterium]